MSWEACCFSLWPSAVTGACQESGSGQECNELSRVGGQRSSWRGAQWCCWCPGVLQWQLGKQHGTKQSTLLGVKSEVLLFDLRIIFQWIRQYQGWDFVIDLANWDQKKWTPFRRWYFQIHYFSMKIVEISLNLYFGIPSIIGLHWFW